MKRANFKKLILLAGMIMVGIAIFMLPVFGFTADEYFEFASSKYLKGDIKGSIQDVNQALKINPKHAGALELKALLEEEGALTIEEEKPKEVTPAPAPAPTVIVTPAAPAPKKAAEGIEDAHAYFVRGEEYFKAGLYDKAEEHFMKVLSIIPGHAETQDYLNQIAQQRIAGPVKIPGPQREQYFRLLLIIFVIIAVLAFLVFVVLKFINRFWHGHHTYCIECKTRNSRDAEFCKKCGSRLRLVEMTDAQKAWFGKFHWQKNPFTLNIIPETLAGHKNDIGLLIEKLSTLSGHVLILGELGTGKTTLLQWLERKLKSHFETIYVIRPPRRPDELIDLMSATISKKTSLTRKYSIYEFQDLCKNYKRDILLLLDEAHEFYEEFEKFLRTLSDLPNVYLILAGLPQSREKLKRELPALFDRLVDTLLLGSLTREETQELIVKRITHAGGTGAGPFTVAAVDMVYELSGGVPRAILKICDWTVTRAVRSNAAIIDEPNVSAYADEVPELKVKAKEEPKESSKPETAG
ncbi:MAG: AAA family ATPase [Candidatus Margulisbacteria bacterium]|nr:AAA family ATPase [Candidatus Margulisiibacteriota bacterium]MBU1021426.1 AAA family ATPase [Candidatus Margulisiibacteriota bacterium]MBU1728347.1 AAA family ATPase [Candidatus Margulisiibacteriota bacterium]MBU1955910.1 AAA family ATPase [Candidatus Margulisiibacteriota bacterium]